MKDFDELVSLEELLIANLPAPSQVDGHDFGSGEFNIFVFTDEPKAIFELARKIVGEQSSSELKAAYRTLNGDDYVILWPEGLKEFNIG